MNIRDFLREGKLEDKRIEHVGQFYKENKSEVEAYIEEFFKPEHQEEIFRYFFGLNIKFIDYFEDDNNKVKLEEKVAFYTKEDITNFILFAKHIAKRIVNAKHHKFGNGYMKDGLLMHDIAHAVGLVARGVNLTNYNSVTPEFLKTKEDFDFVQRELIEEELYGSIFDVVSTKLDSTTTVYANMVLDIVEGCDTFEEFLSKYLKANLDASRLAGLNLLKDFKEKKNVNYEFTEYYEDFDKIKENIIKNPPEKLINMLKYIWENRFNNSVLIDLFMRETSVYIQKLKSRVT